MICDTCTKRRGQGCAVLSGKLPAWGESCSAYSEDPDWEERAKEAVENYRAKGGGRGEMLLV